MVGFAAKRTSYQMFGLGKFEGEVLNINEPRRYLSSKPKLKQGIIELVEGQVTLRRDKNDEYD